MQDIYQLYIYTTFVQTLLYGIYVTTLVHCLRWLLLDDEGWTLRRRMSWFILIISILLFLFSTADLALSLKLLISYNEPWTTSAKFGDIFVRVILIVDIIATHRILSTR